MCAVGDAEFCARRDVVRSSTQVDRLNPGDFETDGEALEIEPMLADVAAVEA